MRKIILKILINCICIMLVMLLVVSCEASAKGILLEEAEIIDVKEIETTTDIEVNFDEVTHPRGEFSVRTYKALKVSIDIGTIEIETKCLTSDMDKLEIASIISKDVELIKNISGKNEYKELEIYIVKEDPRTGKDLNESYYIENMIIINMDHFISREYRHSLVGVLLDNNIPWLSYGIASVIFEDELDVNSVREYYDDVINSETLDLFGGRFFKHIANSNILNAKLTAHGLVEYLVDKYGYEYILELITDHSNIDLDIEKNLWLESIGVKNRYQNNGINSLEFFEFLYEGYYDIVILASHASYKIIMQEDKEYLISSCEGLIKFLDYNMTGINEIKDLINKEKIDNTMMQLDVVPTYIINEAHSPAQSYTDGPNDIIYLHSTPLLFAHIHEYVHAINVYSENEHRKGNIEYSFFIEGLACYLPTEINNKYSCKISNFDKYESLDLYALFLNNAIKNNCDGNRSKYKNDGKKFEEDISNFYLEKGGEEDIINDFDRRLFMDAYSYAIFEQYDFIEFGQFSDRYPLYESYVRFMVNKYSLSEVISATVNFKDYRIIFGKSFNETQDEWIEYLRGL